MERQAGHRRQQRGYSFEVWRSRLARSGRLAGGAISTDTVFVIGRGRLAEGASRADPVSVVRSGRLALLQGSYPCGVEEDQGLEVRNRRNPFSPFFPSTLFPCDKWAQKLIPRGREVRWLGAKSGCQKGEKEDSLHLPPPFPSLLSSRHLVPKNPARGRVWEGKEQKCGLQEEVEEERERRSGNILVSNFEDADVNQTN